MKQYSVCRVLLVTVVVSAKLSPDEEKCMKEVGISGEDVEMYQYAPTAPETREEKCFWGCLMQAEGSIAEDGKMFSRRGYLNAMLPLVRNDEKRQRCLLHFADKCDGLANEDRCELGWMVMECLGLTYATFSSKTCQ